VRVIPQIFPRLRKQVSHSETCWWARRKCSNL
jgi:hypothetical protein